MKNNPKKPLIITIAVMLTAVSAQAVTFTDTVGDTRSGNALMDITQVEVTHDASSIHFGITLSDGAAFWSNAFTGFSVGFDTVAGGDTANNAWSNTWFMSSGMDFFSGGFPDSGSGAGVNTYSAALGGWPEWQSGDNTWVEFDTPVISGDTISFSVSRASLGLTSSTASFDFDVYTHWSSGDIADALGSSAQILANGYDSGSNVNTYAVPEPASAAMILSMAAVFLAFAKRRF